MILSPEILQFINNEVVTRFTRYVRIATTSDPNSDQKPTTAKQHVLLKLLAQELEELGALDVTHAPNGFTYATLKGAADYEPFSLMAHVDM